MKRLLDHDPVLGVTQIFHYDESSGDVHIETVQDVEPYIDVNKALQNDDEYTKHGIKEGMWKYASIPVWVQEKWLTEYGFQNWPMHPQNSKLLFKLLNSPEWRYLKTTSKVHSGR